MSAIQAVFQNQYHQISPYLPAAFFSGGFVFDIATLGRIDNIFNIISHGMFLFFVLFLLVLQIVDVHPKEDAGKCIKLAFKYQNDAVHFLLGALLNAFIIFYFKCGSFVNTFFLVIILFALLLINEIEFFKKKGPLLKVVLFTISLCSFFIYVIPVLIGKAGAVIFILSLLCAFLVILLVGYFLVKLNADVFKVRTYLLIPATTVIVLFSLLYAAHIIPPVPLSLKQIGIYHDIKKQNGNFILYSQTPSWKFWLQGDQNFEAREGDRIYLFSRIFAPGGFKGKLYYHFQIKDSKNKWETTDKIPMNIVGGRDEGFRGYASKTNYTAGSWRAMVETDGGLEVGRIKFQVIKSEDVPERKFLTETY